MGFTVHQPYCVSHILTHVIYITILLDKYCYYPGFTKGEAKHGGVLQAPKVAQM